MTHVCTTCQLQLATVEHALYMLECDLDIFHLVPKRFMLKTEDMLTTKRTVVPI